MGLRPGVLRLNDLVAGVWNGWWHTQHQPGDGPVWLSALPRPSSPKFGYKGAAVGQALRCRYHQLLYVRAPPPSAYSLRSPYTWRWYLAPIWLAKTGAALWRPTWHGRVELQGDPPSCWHLRPLRRLTLFEGKTAAGRLHTVGVDRWGRVWDNDPARQPCPNPTPAATWLDVAKAMHALLPLVTDVWWAILPPGGGPCHGPVA